MSFQWVKPWVFQWVKPWVFQMGETMGFPMGETMGFPMGETMGFPMGETMGFPMGETMGFPRGETMGFPRGDFPWVSHGFSQVDRLVEVPQITYEERIVEVVQREVREIIKQVPKPVVQYVDKILSWIKLDRGASSCGQGLFTIVHTLYIVYIYIYMCACVCDVYEKMDGGWHIEMSLHPRWIIWSSRNDWVSYQTYVDSQVLTGVFPSAPYPPRFMVKAPNFGQLQSHWITMGIVGWVKWSPWWERHADGVHLGMIQESCSWLQGWPVFQGRSPSTSTTTMTMSRKSLPCFDRRQGVDDSKTLRQWCYRRSMFTLRTNVKRHKVYASEFSQKGIFLDVVAPGRNCLGVIPLSTYQSPCSYSFSNPLYSWNMLKWKQERESLDQSERLLHPIFRDLFRVDLTSFFEPKSPIRSRSSSKASHTLT